MFYLEHNIDAILLARKKIYKIAAVGIQRFSKE